MDADAIIHGLQAASMAAQALAPLAGSAGLDTGAVGRLTAATAEIAANIVERVDEGKLVLSSNDETFVRETAAKLAKVNDDLAARIALS
jgi:hypothetical protein